MIMEKTVYFIENKETGKWVAPMFKCHFQDTNNPHKAIAFETREKAEWYGVEENQIITEHIFIEETNEFI